MPLWRLVGMKEIFCPACNVSMPETAPCEHYKRYNWKAGENEEFFVKLIKQNYEPGSSMGWKGKRKCIGTSVGNTRTKNTRCLLCGKDLNGLTYAKIEKHKEEHRKLQGQASLI